MTSSSSGSASKQISDSDLLAEFVSGQSNSAFAALVNRYAPLVYGATLRLCTDPQLAEEAGPLSGPPDSGKRGQIFQASLPETSRLTSYNL